jgi:hypothetical protein
MTMPMFDMATQLREANTQTTFSQVSTVAGGHITPKRTPADWKS